MELNGISLDELGIVYYPHPALRQRAKHIDEIDESIEKLARKMVELMYANKGVGLAANQVGVPVRLFVANPTGEKGNELIFVNPEIVEANGWAEAEEGCLSLPQIYGNVRRNKTVIIVATDLAGARREMKVTDLLARIVQHESDHLDGRLIVDRFSVLAKMSCRSRLKELEALARKSS